jgi:hypothetical protein
MGTQPLDVLVCTVDTRKMPRQDTFGIQELPEQLIITSAGFLRLLGIWTYIQRERTNMSCAYNMTDKDRKLSPSYSRY